ncbi:hypothetical protein J3459_014138 [Metarhizium acridum]|nr:hypothetical protein J3459_014138 [Metarhizium acridum]
MNIAQPISSEVDAVDFTFLSPEEIQAISVKRIENDSTFDSLLNPVHGGLYDPALGSWGDEPCATCSLTSSSCPGHPGHIQLPAPVYHPVFMDQAYHLLRAACVYCKGFRIPPKDLHKYMCKLRLLQHGLIREAHIVDALGEADWSEMEEALGLDESEADEENSSIDNVTRKREQYVQECLRSSALRRGDTRKGKHEGMAQARREIIKQFLSEITKRRQCASCAGISPSYRKDRFVKIFEKSLSPKERTKMALKNFARKDAMTRHYDAKLDPKADVETSEPDAIVEPLSDQDEEEPNDGATSQRYISPMEVRARLSELFKKEQDIVSLLYNSKPRTRSSPDITPDMFFITTILVPAESLST